MCEGMCVFNSGLIVCEVMCVFNSGLIVCEVMCVCLILPKMSLQPTHYPEGCDVPNHIFFMSFKSSAQYVTCTPTDTHTDTHRHTHTFTNTKRHGVIFVCVYSKRRLWDPRHPVSCCMRITPLFGVSIETTLWCLRRKVNTSINHSAEISIQ